MNSVGATQETDGGQRLSVDGCRAKAQECRAAARTARLESHRTMLLHMADTWDRIAADILKRGSGTRE